MNGHVLAWLTQDGHRYEEIADALGEGIESALESAGARMLRVPSKEGSGFARNASSVLRARSTEHRGQSGVGRTVSVEVERVKKVELGVNEVTGAAEQEIEVDNEEPKMSREQIMASKLDMFAGSDLAMIGSHVFAAMMLIMVWVFVQTDDFDEFSGIIPWTETLTRFGIGIAMMSLSDALQAPAIEKRFPEMANEKERMLAMSSLRPLDWATAIFFIACVGSMFCFGWLAAV